MIVDVHAHYHPRSYIEALERAGVVRAGRGGMAGHPDTDDAAHSAVDLALGVTQPGGERASTIRRLWSTKAMSCGLCFHAIVTMQASEDRTCHHTGVPQEPMPT
jgi:hypothetical protein